MKNESTLEISLVDLSQILRSSISIDSINGPIFKILDDEQEICVEHDQNHDKTHDSTDM